MSEAVLPNNRFKSILDSVPTIVDGDCEWDADKAAANLEKHGVAFEEAATVFADTRVAVRDDGSGSVRLLAIGFSVTGRLLAVVHVERGDRDRIVSARAATPEEERIYSGGKPT